VDCVVVFGVEKYATFLKFFCGKKLGGEIKSRFLPLRGRMTTKGKGNGSLAGGGFTSHPSHSARRMGHPFCWGCPKGDKGNGRSPYGDDNKKAPATAHWLVEGLHPTLRIVREGWGTRFVGAVRKGTRTTAGPLAGMTKKSKSNGSLAGGGFTSHPSHGARRMGHPFCWGCPKGDKDNGRFRAGMTTR
jgi:hypothetical protein